ncbi:MAG: nicotinate (nicotinamide) nucleotide adenylyltransferase [Capnocytophaga sp.]|nr:nicotinate (nicotinamide) nucleotide adenylyltransferase [Capnocytophaga sp.]
MKKRLVGLFFGSFNPIHVGHVIIANHLVEHSDMSEIWLVVTPQNPFKDKKTLLDNHHRLEMVDRALKEYEKLQPSDIEFRLPQPNYTIHTLAYLQEKYPAVEFALIMGEDNLKSFHRWKNYEQILDNHHLYVYPRLSEGQIPDVFVSHPKISKIDAPIIGLSATFVREEIKAQRNVAPLIHPDVWDYIDRLGLYL